MTKKEIKQRNKEESKKKLIDSVGQIIIRDGFKGIGINTIAREANLDKVLIYRYFDGLDGLLRAFAMQKDFYLNISDQILKAVENARSKDIKELVIQILTAQLYEILKNKELQQLMLWEMIERNEITIAIAKEREEKGYELSYKLKQKLQLDNVDTDAVIALLVSGIYYLILRSKTVDIFNGVELNSDDGWKRIENAIRLIIQSIFNAPENKKI